MLLRAARVRRCARRASSARPAGRARRRRHPFASFSFGGGEGMIGRGRAKRTGRKFGEFRRQGEWEGGTLLDGTAEWVEMVNVSGVNG